MLLGNVASARPFTISSNCACFAGPCGRLPLRRNSLTENGRPRVSGQTRTSFLGRRGKRRVILFARAVERSLGNDLMSDEQ